MTTTEAAPDKFFFVKRQHDAYMVERANGVCIGRIQKVDVSDTYARARMGTRTEWKATTRSGRKIAGTFATRTEAAQAIAAIVTVGR